MNCTMKSRRRTIKLVHLYAKTLEVSRVDVMRPLLYINLELLSLKSKNLQLRKIALYNVKLLYSARPHTSPLSLLHDGTFAICCLVTPDTNWICGDKLDTLSSSVADWSTASAIRQVDWDSTPDVKYWPYVGRGQADWPVTWASSSGAYWLPPCLRHSRKTKGASEDLRWRRSDARWTTVSLPCVAVATALSRQQSYVKQFIRWGSSASRWTLQRMQRKTMQTNKTSQDKTRQCKTRPHIITRRHNTEQPNTGQHDTGQHNRGQHNAGQHNTGQYNELQHKIGQNNTGQYNELQHNIGQNNTG